MNIHLTSGQIAAGAKVLMAYKKLRLNWRNAAIDVFEAMTAAAPWQWQVQVRAGDEWRAVTTWVCTPTIKTDTFDHLFAALDALAIMERVYEEHSFRAHPINRAGSAG